MNTETITLMDGREMVCYLKPEEKQEPVRDTKIQLDTTGEYLSIGGKKPTFTDDKTFNERRIAGHKLFTDHAWLFWKNADRVLSDSRLFFAPVPVKPGLAYTGTSGFGQLTVGIMIEWWLYGPSCLLEDKAHQPALTWFVSGSPLSGGNACSCVHEDGTTEKIQHNTFSSVWKSLMKISSQYSRAYAKYEHYSIEQCIDILQKMPEDECSRLRSELLLTNAIIVKLKQDLDKKKDEVKQLQLKIDGLSHDLFHHELLDYCREYLERKQKTEEEIAAINVQRSALKARLRKGELDNIAYQKLLMPLNKEKEKIDSNFYFWNRDKENYFHDLGVTSAAIGMAMREMKEK